MYINVHAIVLRAEKTGEHDKRLCLFTREKGRLFAVAAGAVRPRARLAAATEPAVESRFRLWMPPGRSTARVTGGTLACGFPRLRRDWARHAAALFFCEWTDRLTGWEQPNPEKFDLLRDALEGLETGDPDAIRLAFMVRFLEQAGYWVGPDMLGSAGHARWQSLLSTLRTFDFSGPSPDVSRAELLEEQLVYFVGPLLASPLKTLAYRRTLKNFLRAHSPSPIPHPLSSVLK